VSHPPVDDDVDEIPDCEPGCDGDRHDPQCENPDRFRRE